MARGPEDKHGGNLGYYRRHPASREPRGSPPPGTPRAPRELQKPAETSACLPRPRAGARDVQMLLRGAARTCPPCRAAERGGEPATEEPDRWVGGRERAGEVREARARKKKSRSVPVFGELMSSTQGGRGWRRAGDRDSDRRGALGRGRLERGRRSGQGLQTFISRPGQGGVDAFYGGQSFNAAAAARLLGF